MLSRRKLDFGKQELRWICLEGSCAERMPAEEDIKSLNNPQYVVKHALIAGPARPGNPRRVDEVAIFNCWLDAVEEYLKRRLSEPRDKLTAIVGVQSAIGKVLDDDPVAGIWRGQFCAPSILWSVQKKDLDDPGTSFPCPSWSWASAAHSVKCIRHSTCTDNSRPWV